MTRIYHLSQFLSEQFSGVWTNLQNFLQLAKIKLYPLNDIFPSPQLLEITVLFSFSVNLSTLGTTYKWSHTLFVFL